MATTFEWQDLALRLALAIVAGALIGFNRGEEGHPAGMRTTLLVCAAAALAMMQANILMASTEEGSASAIRIDVMRLPLGILSGMGFIGAGAILKHGKDIAGLTTAATLWFVTVIGLCFGGGQISLGLAGLGVALVTLWVLKWAERRAPLTREAMLTLTTTPDGPSPRDVIGSFGDAGIRISSCAVSVHEDDRTAITCTLQYKALDREVLPPPAVSELAQRPGVVAFDWKR